MIPVLVCFVFLQVVSLPFYAELVMRSAECLQGIFGEAMIREVYQIDILTWNDQIFHTVTKATTKISFSVLSECVTVHVYLVKDLCTVLHCHYCVAALESLCMLNSSLIFYVRFMHCVFTSIAVNLGVIQFVLLMIPV